MHSLILMDEHDKPMTRVITWADNRAAAYATKLKQSDLGMTLFKATGVPTHPMSPLVKLLWLNDAHPG